MDAGFKMLAECDFGTVWFVPDENKVVVHAYQAALYFDPDGFKAFASMAAEAQLVMGGTIGAPAVPPKPAVERPKTKRPRPEGWETL